MTTRKKNFLTALILVVLPLSLIVGSRMRWSANPDYFRMEFYGLAYNTTVPLSALCDPNPLAGLRGPMSNVTDQRSFSLLYALPTKLLRPFVDPLTTQRALSVSLYIAALVFLAASLTLLDVRLSLLLFAVGYFGASEQFLSYIFEYKLTLSSVAWLAGALLLFFAAVDSTAKERGNALLLAALIPPVSVSAYETYCVSRPLAVVYWGTGLLFVLFSAVPRKRIAAGAYLVSTALSCILLKAVHPGMRFDQTLFEGRTESIVALNGHISTGSFKVLKTRLGESAALFKWPRHSFFVSESLKEAGWLEIWIALAVLLAVFAIVNFTRSGKGSCRFLRVQRWNLLLLVALAGTSLAIPFFSTTFLRGHRFFGFYLCSSMLTVALAEAVMQSGKKYLVWSLSVIAVVALAATFIHRMPLIYNYRFTPPGTEQNNNRQELQLLIADLKTLNVSAALASGPPPRVLYICDKRVPPVWEHSWNAALYLSDLGCRLGVRGMAWLGEGCTCREDRIKGEPSLCIIRTLQDGRNVFQVVRN